MFAKALLPIAIALAGHLFGRALSRAQVEAAERLRQRDVASARELKERDIAVSMQHSRAQQASVVNTFMQALLSENQREELERRAAEDDAAPDDVIPWEQVKAAALGRLKP